MKKFKCLLSLVMVLVMLVGLCACSQPAEPITTPNNNGNTQPDSTEPKYDFGGKTIKIAVWYEPEIPNLGDSDSEDAWYYSLKHAAEEFNCEIEWIVDTQEAHFSNFIQKSLGGEVYADIMMCHSWNYVSLIKQGLILPTTEYVANAPDAERWNQSTYILNGENWGLMPIEQNYIPTNYFLVNTKLLNSLGLENPQKLAKEGKWDWETFRRYCAEATDPGKEQYGVGCFMLAHMIKTGNDFSYAVKDENGVYQNAFTHPSTHSQAMEVLELVQKMALEDKSVLGAWTDGQEAMNETLNAFKDGKLLFAYYPSPSSLKKAGFTDYSVVTVPMGPSATQLHDTVEAFAFWCLPKESSFTAEERAAFWMEAKRIWDPADEEGYYEESEESRLEELLDETYINREDVQFLLDMGKNMELLPDISVSWGPLIADDIFGAVIRGDSTPAAVIEQTAGEVQAKIDETYNK